METDISNKTIVVLVLLTVIISVLSTLVVLNEVTNPSTSFSSQENTQSGGSAQVSLNIKPAPAVDSATGRVTLSIKPKGEQ